MKLLVRISASRAGRSARRGRWWTMSKAKHRYEIEGRGWLIASRAAALLGTNAAGIRKLMGDGTLEWRQARTNSSVLVVDERQDRKSVVQGKSVSVRVDLGGRRIIKQKKRQTECT